MSKNLPQFPSDFNENTFNNILATDVLERQRDLISQQIEQIYKLVMAKQATILKNDETVTFELNTQLFFESKKYILAQICERFTKVKYLKKPKSTYDTRGNFVSPQDYFITQLIDEDIHSCYDQKYVIYLSNITNITK